MMGCISWGCRATHDLATDQQQQQLLLVSPCLMLPQGDSENQLSINTSMSSFVTLVESQVWSISETYCMHQLLIVTATHIFIKQDLL